MNQLIFNKTLLVVALSAAAVSAHASILSFDLQGRSGAGLRFDNENPTATGAGTSATGGEFGAGITFDDVSKVLTINVAWGSGNGFPGTDLSTNAIAAHLHAASSSSFTENGGVIFSLDGLTPGFNPSASFGGWTNTKVTLNQSQESFLNDGFLYLNVHTSSNPGGEIRGNLVSAVPEPESYALMLAGMGLVVAVARRRKAKQA